MVADDRLNELCGLLKDRCDTLVSLAEWIALFYGDVHPKAEDVAKYVTPEVKPAVQALRIALASCEWSVVAIACNDQRSAGGYWLKNACIGHARARVGHGNATNAVA